MIKINNFCIVVELFFVFFVEFVWEILMIDEAARIVVEGRRCVVDVFSGRDGCFLVVVGPCSIYDFEVVMDYVHWFFEFVCRYVDCFFVVMWVYFEKFCMVFGWCGFVMDLGMDGSYDIVCGFCIVCGFFVKINDLGLFVGSEMFDLIVF